MPDYDLGTARGKIELDASSLGRAEASFKSLGKGMIATGAVAVGAFAYAVKSAADFEKIMSAVGAVTGATGREMDLLKDKALDLAAGSIFSADQIGKAFEDLGKAGITVDEILGGAAEAVVHLAHAAGDELPGGIAQGAEIIANAMKTFEVGADQAEHFADVLVAAAASSTISVDDMATSFRYAGPIAHELGLSIDDLATVLAILGDRGIKGSTAGTSLRGVLLSLTPTSAKAANVMKDLGLITEDGTNRFYDMNGALKPIPEVMKILGEATKDLSEEQKVQAFNSIFQRRAMNAALILADQGAAGFNKYADAIARLDASTIAAKKLDNLHGDMTILKNTVDALIIRVGLPLQDMLRGWVQSLTDLVNKLAEVNPELLAQILMYAAIGGAVLIAAGSFLYMVGVAIKLYRNFVLLMEAIKLVMGAAKLLTLSFLTNPVVLFIAAIAALIAILYLAYTRSEEFRERVDKALMALKPAFDAVKGFVENFVEQFGNLIDVIKEGDDVAQGVAEVIDNMFGNTGKLVEPIRNLVNALGRLDDMARTAFDYFAQHILPTLWDFSIVVGGAVADAISWFIDEGVPAIQKFSSEVIRQIGLAIEWLNRNVVPVFTDVADLITAALDRIIRVVRFFAPYFVFAWERVFAILKVAYDVIDSVVTSILLIWGNFSDNIFRIITGAWQRVKQTIESVLRIIRGIIQLFTGIISGDWEKAWGGVQMIFTGIWSAIIDFFQNIWFIIWNILSAGIDAIISIWEVGWNTVFDFFSTGWEFMRHLFESILKLILGMLINTLKLIYNTWISIWQSIFNWFAPKIRLITTIVGDVITGVVRYFQGLWGRITGAIGDLAGKVYNFFKTAWDRMYTAISFQVTNMINFVKGIPQKIITALGNVGHMLYDAGKKIIQGLIDGIDRMLGPLDEVVGGVAKKIGGFLPGSPVKEGPLRVLNRGYAGAQIMKMLMDGISRELPTLERLMGVTLAVPLTAGGAQSLSGLPATSSGGGTTIAVNFEFPNVTSAAEADGIVDAVNDGDVLSKLVSTLKAGRR